MPDLKTNNNNKFSCYVIYSYYIEGRDNNFVRQNSPWQYKNSHNIYQILSISFAYYGNQKQLYSSLSFFVYYLPFQLYVLLLIELLQLYYVKFIKQLSLPKSSNLYVISRRRLDNVLYALNYSHLIPRPPLEHFDKQYWDFRFGNHKCCCSYTSLLFQCTFQHNTLPRCTSKASCSSDYHLSCCPIKYNRT